jgi:hypothetical protein
VIGTGAIELLVPMTQMKLGGPACCTPGGACYRPGRIAPSPAGERWCALAAARVAAMRSARVSVDGCLVVCGAKYSASATDRLAWRLPFAVARRAADGRVHPDPGQEPPVNRQRRMSHSDCGFNRSTQRTAADVLVGRATWEVDLAIVRARSALLSSLSAAFGRRGR